jgi:PhzF family phenazine biosynthesis protein
MQTFKYKKIDAFATKNSDGNPAGYVYLQEGQTITANEMQRIAREQRGAVNEVGFVRRKSESAFDLKFYSAEREVDFCGHATIAIMYALLRNDAAARLHQVLTITTNRGTLSVFNHVEKEDAVFIVSPIPQHIDHVPAVGLIAEALRVRPTDIDCRFPVKIINAGLTTLLVPITTLDAILAITPDLDQLKSFCVAHAIDIIEVFTADVALMGSDYRARVFAPTFGYLEDPATGSGNSAFGYYLLSLALWQGKALSIEQNDQRERCNVVKLRTMTDEDGQERVLFGGGAITRIDGSYFLY